MATTTLYGLGQSQEPETPFWSHWMTEVLVLEPSSSRKGTLAGSWINMEQLELEPALQHMGYWLRLETTHMSDWINQHIAIYLTFCCMTFYIFWGLWMHYFSKSQVTIFLKLKKLSSLHHRHGRENGSIILPVSASLPILVRLRGPRGSVIPSSL